MEIYFTPRFRNEFKKLPIALQDEANEKIALLCDHGNHKTLKVHKLHGQLDGRYSFSVNYAFRVVFMYLSKDKVALLSIGDHNVYK